jgi:hypothetical protein
MPPSVPTTPKLDSMMRSLDSSINLHFLACMFDSDRFTEKLVHEIVDSGPCAGGRELIEEAKGGRAEALQERGGSGATCSSLQLGGGNLARASGGRRTGNERWLARRSRPEFVRAQ